VGDRARIYAPLRMPEVPSTPLSIAVRRLSAAERSTAWRLRLRVRERVARSLVFLPALYLLAAVGLGIALPAIDRARGSSHVLGIDDSAAQSILEAIASGMIAFSGLVVSVAVLVVQFGAGQYSPRLVQIFRRDPVIKNALGLFVSPGVYALVAVGDIGGTGDNDKPQTLAVLVGLLLMIAALIALFRFIGRLLDLMRPRRIYARLMQEARGSIADVYPQMLDDAVEYRDSPREATGVVLENEHRDGVLAAVDRQCVVRAARDAGAVVGVAAQLGMHVPHDTPVFLVHGGPGIDADALRSAVVYADGRTITQDPAFAMRCIVDVAVRALSAAINDPTSAVEGLDALNAVLLRLGRRQLGDAGIVDDDGALRLVLPTPGWDELVDLGLTEIRVYGAGSPQVARRLRALLDGLEAVLPAERAPALQRHRALLDAALERHYSDPGERRFAATADRLGVGGAA
jgi:uncharacterized membrane protein